MIFQFLLALLFAHPVVAYDQHSTHPSLTYEMAEFFNIKNENLAYELTVQEAKWLMRGAEEEDEPARWINHFYDPVHGNGWSGKHFGKLSQEEGYKTGADLAPRESIPSYQWVTNQEYQSAYGRQFGNQTWQKAIKSYVDGDKQSAFVALGHVLHIVEDATVPDHVRDDSHPGIEGDPGSPYEAFAKTATDAGELQVAENLKSDLLVLGSIGGAIQDLAKYTNTNFFSEDTISNEEFSEPYSSSKEVVLEINNKYVTFLTKNGYRIARLLESDFWSGKKIYTTDDTKNVLPSYRDHLFPKAVLTGASVIKLFFAEVEKAKQNTVAMEPIVPDKNDSFLVALWQAPKRNVIKVCGYSEGICTGLYNTFSEPIKKGIAKVLDQFGIPVFTQSVSELVGDLNPDFLPVSTNSAPVKIAAEVIVLKSTIPKPPAPAPKPTPAPVIVEEVVPPVPQPVAETPAPEIVLPPPAPVAPKPSFILAVGYTPPTPPPTPSENVEIASLAPIIESVASTTPDSVASSTVLASEEVTTSTESIATSTEFVATSTLISSTTLVATTTVEISTTTITTTTPEISTSTISVTTTTETVTTTTSTPAIEPVPEVVINEIAWAGTASTHADDEWFELYNNTDHDIDLTEWKIFVSGKQVNLKINNAIILARGYYLLERKEDSVIRDIGADAIYSLAGGFNNNGAKVELLNPDGVKVDEVDSSDGWFAGDKIKYRSMERLDSTKDGNDPANWQSNISYRPTGQNVESNPVYGSPRQSNFGFLVLHSIQEENIKTLDIKNSPYVVWSYQIPAGKTLNIDEGVDIFMLTYGTINISGSLNALGTQDKPINFVPYPTSTAWANLRFYNSTSTFNFVNIRRGDRTTRLLQNLDGMLLAKNSNLTINNTLIWDSEANAIGGTDSVYNISNTTIGASVKNNKTYGINARGGVLSLDNVTFNNLYVGVEAGGSADPHPELYKNNTPDTNFINVDYIAEPLKWWNSASSTRP